MAVRRTRQEFDSGGIRNVLRSLRSRPYPRFRCECVGLLYSAVASGIAAEPKLVSADGGPLHGVLRSSLLTSASCARRWLPAKVSGRFRNQQLHRSIIAIAIYDEHRFQ